MARTRETVALTSHQLPSLCPGALVIAARSTRPAARGRRRQKARSPPASGPVDILDSRVDVPCEVPYVLKLTRDERRASCSANTSDHPCLVAPYRVEIQHLREVQDTSQPNFTGIIGDASEHRPGPA